MHIYGCVCGWVGGDRENEIFQHAPEKMSCLGGDGKSGDAAVRKVWDKDMFAKIGVSWS